VAPLGGYRLFWGPPATRGNPFPPAFTMVGSACLLAPVPADPPASAELPIRRPTRGVVGQPDWAAQVDGGDPRVRRDVRPCDAGRRWPRRRAIGDRAGLGDAWLA